MARCSSGPPPRPKKQQGGESSGGIGGIANVDEGPPPRRRRRRQRLGPRRPLRSQGLRKKRVSPQRVMEESLGMRRLILHEVEHGLCEIRLGMDKICKLHRHG
eukprot:6171088-Lingulodinium_polyedra.AAC.1